MPNTPNSGSGREALAAIGIVALPILCCGMPVLIAAGGLGALGSFLGNPWVIGAAVLIALGVIAWRRNRRRDGAASHCGVPEPLADSNSADMAGPTRSSEEH